MLTIWEYYSIQIMTKQSLSFEKKYTIICSNNSNKKKLKK